MHMADHGLFIAGLIHDLAPDSPLELQPVLAEDGTGDFELLLRVLVDLVNGKAPTDPLIINLSLGFLPHPVRLPAMWYGLDRPNDPGFVSELGAMPGQGSGRSATPDRAGVAQSLDMLEVGLRLMAEYLQANNCLVVAAAGNDSRTSVELGQPRLSPRLPARFETTLGVAATAADPSTPAPYSNIGDELELGDHVATFGGGANADFLPSDGVIGLFSGDFPSGRPNETGWARWSGTSFATGIAAAAAARLWSSRPKLSAADALYAVHRQAAELGPYVAELRTPAIPVYGEWT
jgi:hypothetical protein